MKKVFSLLILVTVLMGFSFWKQFGDETIKRRLQKEEKQEIDKEIRAINKATREMERKVRAINKTRKLAETSGLYEWAKERHNEAIGCPMTIMPFRCNN